MDALKNKKYNSSRPTWVKIVVLVLRKATGSILFRKSLPRRFGKGTIYVTTRSDIRLIAPGWKRSADDLVEVVDRYVKPGDVVWDIGSNLGILSLCSALRCGTSGRVFSMEADPKYADIQARSIMKLSDDAAKIDILCAAVADRIGILELLIPKKGHARNHLTSVSGNSAGEAENRKPVVTVTLDWLLDYWKNPNFIKIDVEGAEVMAVKGAEKLFREIRPIGYIECSTENQQAMTEFFKLMDYDLYSFGPDGVESPIKEFVFNTIVKPRVVL